MEQYKGICFAKKRMTSASCLLLGKVQNVQGSLYVKGFGAAAVRESNQGCNEELC
jgi:hypothetical protein